MDPEKHRLDNSPRSLGTDAFFTADRAIGRAQLLGWPAPPGEEWHDMLLIEFAWEYLT
jgi:hypothetical protein